MDDLISRQAAIDALGDMPMSWADTDAEIQAQEDWKKYREALLNLPTADTDLSEYSEKLWKAAYERGRKEAEPRKGKWVGVTPLTDSRQCSVCGFCIYSEELETPYCGWCGAKMEE